MLYMTVLAVAVAGASQMPWSNVGEPVDFSVALLKKHPRQDRLPTLFESMILAGPITYPTASPVRFS